MKKKIKFQKSSNPQKMYATTSTGGACIFRYDYSMYMNAVCLGCKFCYKDIDSGTRKKRYGSDAVKIESLYNKNLFDFPITVSRYCDPLYSGPTASHSFRFMEYILDGGGYIIFRSAKHEIPENIIDLLTKYKDRVQYQPRLFATDSAFGEIIRNEFCKKFSEYKQMVNVANKISDLGIDVVPYLDPLILHINDQEMAHIINELPFKRYIVRQLFSTRKFREELGLMVNRAKSSLTEQVKEYYTYSSMDILKHFIPRIKADVEIAFCQNRDLNKLLGIKNCCFFDKSKKMFNIDVNFLGRHQMKTSTILPLGGENV